TTLCRALAGFGGWPQAGLCLTNSRWTASQIADLLKVDSHVVYPAVVPFPGQIALDRRGPEFRVASLGRLVAYKGHDVVVRALSSAVRKTGQRASILFLGRGTEGDVAALRALTSTDVDVHVIENASRQEIGHALRDCSVGVSAFRFEHFGIAIAE